MEIIGLLFSNPSGMATYQNIGINYTLMVINYVQKIPNKKSMSAP